VWSDPDRVTYGDLLDTLWHMHSPTTPNRQGWDVGDQYRSAIFFGDSIQRHGRRDARTIRPVALRREMTRVIAFDVNETLLDLRALDALFEELLGSAQLRGQRQRRTSPWRTDAVEQILAGDL
jgi:hypothetical protein